VSVRLDWRQTHEEERREAVGNLRCSERLAVRSCNIYLQVLVSRSRSLSSSGVCFSLNTGLLKTWNDNSDLKEGSSTWMTDETFGDEKRRKQQNERIRNQAATDHEGNFVREEEIIMASCYSKIYGRRWMFKTTSPATQISLSLSLSLSLSPKTLQQKKFQTSK